PLAATEDEPASPRRHHSHEKSERSDKPRDPFRHLPDGGRPHLKDLKGRGVLVRKMARGFTIALDRDFKAAGTRWWRTTFGFAVPFDRIMLQRGATKYSGNWFSREGTGGVYFVTSSGATKLAM